MALDLEGRLRAALKSRYAIERELGHGGMAIVYLAADRKHDRRVALKVMRPELAAALGPERFLREVRVAAQLTHPHIVPLYDSGQAGGFLYYAMPYVEGESLRSRLAREGQLPIAEAVQLTREVADALSYAHSLGLVHRDVKPENILLSGGHALMADFGIARALDAAGSEKLTDTGLAIGTPAYMSPEQAAGSSHIDARSDLYSLGCVLYEMLGGGPPFSAPNPQGVVARHTLDPVPPLRTLRTTVPEALEAAVNKALAKAPADRFATATEFAAALSGGGAEPPRKRISLSRARLGLGALLAAALTVVLLIAHRSHPRAGLDADLIAVAPFDVLDPKLELWREGLIDVLARNLDGAGSLRTVSPTVVVRRWQGHSDPVSANDLARRKRYFRAYRGLHPTDYEGVGANIAELLENATPWPRVAKLLDTASTNLLSSTWVLAPRQDSAETEVRLLRLPWPGFDTTVLRYLVAARLAFRGHLREAAQNADVRFPDLFTDLALFGTVSSDSAAAVFQRWLGGDLEAAATGVRWWIARRDTASLLRLRQRADSTARRTRVPSRLRRARGIAELARAALILARGDSAAALRQLSMFPDSLCPGCHDLLFLRFQLLAAAGKDREAVTFLDRDRWYHPGWVLAFLPRGRIAERLGDREKAVQSYQFVADAWRNADPELQPYVRESRAALARLTGEPRPSAP